ncbi:MAG: PEP-utilizing enzyme [Firmicutes bacterium]|nr:PEP-utilizing enzyme [Bacillota bacterium]
MRIFQLGAIDATHINAAGGKAKGLERLAREGFNVPPGFVMIDIEEERDLDAAAEHYLKSGLGKVAVRSSATVEDGADYSYAGQFKTVLNVEGGDEFKKAVLECLNSLEDVTAKEYSEKLSKGGEIKMSVVVQSMVDADFAGVCFTSDPCNADNLLVEAVVGLGEAVVSGTAATAGYSVPRDLLKNKDADFNTVADGQNLLSAHLLKEICIESARLQEIFKMPMDIEWAVKGDTIYWLQARPITVTEVCNEGELDPKEDLTGCVITRCNVGEMLPGAVTPLTLSVSVYAIDFGLRKMLCLAGANKKMRAIPDFGCVFSTSGHLFFNLSYLYGFSKAIYLTGKDGVDMSICGRHLEETGKILGKKANFFKKMHNTRKYLSFVLSRNKARAEITALADTFKIAAGENAAQMYAEIDKAKYAADRVTYLHYITSSHSGAMSSAVIQILLDKLNDADKSKAVLAELLEGIDGIESVDILASLRRVARAVLEDNPAARAYNSEELAVYLKNAGAKTTEARAEFLKRHGHRAIREAELRSCGWADDEKAFTEYLRTVIMSGAKDSETSAPPDLKAVIRAQGFRGLSAKILKYLVNQARDGVKNREYSKSKMIKVLDVFKQAYRKLAVMLVAEGKLPDEDAVFFLTHEELGVVANGAAPALAKKTLQRRRLLKTQQELCFSEVYTKKPVPLPFTSLAQSGEVLRGAPISRGKVTGPARVVKNAADAGQIQKGEIMVAAYTDIGWSPFYCLIEGLVTEVGSPLSHGAVVAREYALPLVSNIAGATSLIQTGDIITVDGEGGCVIKH